LILAEKADYDMLRNTEFEVSLSLRHGAKRFAKMFVDATGDERYIKYPKILSRASNLIVFAATNLGTRDNN
jgi:hypothetical protein